MARGIPRPSILEVPDLFSLPDSPRNRFHHSSDPRQNTPRTPKIQNFIFEQLNMKKNENFRKFSEICQDFSAFQFNFWTYYQTFQTLKYKFNAVFFFRIFQNFGGIFRIFSDFWDNLFIEIPRGPRGIDFIFLDPRGM